MPVVRSIYGATKQILETVILTQSDAFREAVLVEYQERIEVIGFVTGKRSRCLHFISYGQCICANNSNHSDFYYFVHARYNFLKTVEAVKLVVSAGNRPPIVVNRDDFSEKN